MEKITISQLREFADQFLTELKILSVIQGNIMKEDAIAVMKNVLNNIPCHKVNDVSMNHLSSFFNPGLIRGVN